MQAIVYMCLPMCSCAYVFINLRLAASVCVYVCLCVCVQVLVMEWIDGIRCTDPDGIRASGIDVDQFIKCGVVSGLRQLLEFGLFHGDPHPGNIFAVSLMCVA